MKIDELALRLFDSPEQFGEAMTILYESAKMLQSDPSGCRFEYSDFFSGVIEYKQYIYDKAYFLVISVETQLQSLRLSLQVVQNTPDTHQRGFCLSLLSYRHP